MKGLFSWFQIMRVVAVGHAPMESWPEDSYGLKGPVCKEPEVVRVSELRRHPADCRVLMKQMVRERNG